MEWRDEGLIAGVGRYGEHSAIVVAMTREHGRHFGLVRGLPLGAHDCRVAAGQHGRPRLASAA
jgi:recombinational DNA repair protein (RecF pathway)